MRLYLRIPILVLVCAGCDNHQVPVRHNALRITGVADLTTNATTRPRVTFLGAVHSSDGELAREAVFAEVQRAARVVTWPSKSPVAGSWRFIPDLDYEEDGWPDGAIEFIRAGAATSGWEAVIVTPATLPSNFGVAPLAPEIVVRYAPVSRPFLRAVTAIRIPDTYVDPTGYPPRGPEHSHTLSLVFSEPVASAATIHSYVSVSTAGCQAYVSSAPEDVPVESAVYLCPAFAEGEELEIRLIASLEAAAGGTLASAYGRPDGSEIVIRTALFGDETQRSADPTILAMAAGVPPPAEAAP